MKEYRSIEEYADRVRAQAHTILVCCCKDLGPEHRTSIKVLELLSEAADIVQSTHMKREQGAGYDLAALSVDAAVPSNSETGWEKD